MPFSPKQPASMMGTFALVLFFTMLKEAFEDYQRYKQQREVNRKQTSVYSGTSFRETVWESVRAGQLIKIEKDQEVPADVLIIGSSNEESGVVFVDTMALDGETNLKEKVSALEEQIQDLSRLKGSILCELPNDSLEHWEG